MKQTMISAILLLYCTHLAAQHQKVGIQIRISKLDRIGSPTSPFAGIGGITAMRDGVPAQEFVCPNQSDANGNLNCHISCRTNSESASFRILAPLNHTQPSLGYYSPRGNYLAVTLEGCKVSSGAPVNIVYLSPTASIQTFAAVNPTVFNAVASVQNDDTIAFKSFNEAAPELLALDQTTDNKDAVATLSSLARAYAMALKKNPVTVEYRNLSQYDLGGKNILLHVEAAKYLGNAVASQIEVSPEKADLLKNIRTVETALAEHPQPDPKLKAMAEKLEAIQKKEM